MTRPVDAVPAESSAGHRTGRDCDCGPVAMRDLATGAVSIWRHFRFLPDKRDLASIDKAPEFRRTSGAGSFPSGRRAYPLAGAPEVPR